MSIDNVIERAFERHESDVRPGPGAWHEVQRRVRRRHRYRLVATALGATIAVVGAIVVVPKIGPEPNDRFDALPDGWRPIRSDQGGFRVGFPPGWKASDDLGVTVGVPPDAFSSSEGKPLFIVTFSIVPEPYDRTPQTYLFAPDPTTVRGRKANRYSDASLDDTFRRRIIYRIEWPRLCADRACSGAYTLIASIVGTDEKLWERYRPIAERIVQRAEPAPVSGSSTTSFVQAKIGADAISMTSTSDGLWALIPAPGEVARPGSLVKIDPRTNRVSLRLAVGLNPKAVVGGFGSIWVSHGAPQNSVWRFDLATNKATARIKVEDAGDIVAGEGAVWVVGGAGVSVIDPGTNRVRMSVAVGGGGPPRLAVGGGYVWSVAASGREVPAGGRKNTVTILDPKDYHVIEVVDVPAGLSQADITFGFGTAWVTSAGSETPTSLMRIEPGTWKVTRSISLPEAGNTGLDLVTTGEGFVWAVNGRGQLWKVDPVANHPVGASKETIPLTIGDNAPIFAEDVITGFGSVWVASGDGQIWRIAP